MSRVDPRNLSVNVTTPTGRVVRWGGDETDDRFVPKGLRFSTKMPGGFSECTVTLSRRPDVAYEDLKSFAPFTVSGASGALTAFDGYISALPSARDSDYVINPTAIGWAGHMKDDPSFQMIYVDRDLSRWTGVSRSRNVDLVTANFSVSGPESSFDTTAGLPSLLLKFGLGVWSAPFLPICEAMYDAGPGKKISLIYFDPGPYPTTPFSSAAFEFRFGVDDTDRFNTASNSADLWTGSAIPAQYITPGKLSRYAHTFLEYTATPAGQAGSDFAVDLRNLAVYGNHGLTRRGADPGGFYGHDVIAHIISQACPLLNYSTGSGGSIRSSDFIIPHLVIADPTDGASAVDQVNTYFLNDYGVYESKTFFWQPPGTGREWHVRLGDGTTQSDQGTTIETAFNGVIVSYTDPAGVAARVGPPGSGLPVTNTALQDTTATNPANVYGRKHWAVLNFPGITTSTGAAQLGAAFLTNALARPTAGSITVKATAKTSAGVEYPAWMIRAGDTIVIDDSSDTSTHYVLSTDYDHDTLTLTATVDAPPNRIDWLMNRLQVVIAPLGGPPQPSA